MSTEKGAAIYKLPLQRKQIVITVRRLDGVVHKTNSLIVLNGYNDFLEISI